MFFNKLSARCSLLVASWCLANLLPSFLPCLVLSDSDHAIISLSSQLFSPVKQFSSAMVIIQDHNEAIIWEGWPLGLGTSNARIRDASLSLHTSHQSVLRRCTSFSSFSSSSNLDTESTASFYRDRSMSLGRLLGIWPGCKERSAWEDEANVGTHAMADELSHQLHEMQPPKGQTHHSRGICVPLLHHVSRIMKMARRPKTKANLTVAPHEQ